MPIDGDHSKSLLDFELAGIPILANEHVFESFNMKPSVIAKPLKKYKFGGFTILPFEAFHDVPTLGFFINHQDMGNLVFLTDSFMSNHVFRGVNHFLVECNYSDEVLQSAIDTGLTHPAMRKRLMTTHMELKTAEKFILSHNLTEVYNIILIHLSRFNSDRKQFTDILTRSTGKGVVVAETGMKIELNNNPY